MHSSTDKSDAWAVLPVVVIHGILWAWFVDTMVRGVPGFKKIFADFGMRLPAVTELTLDLSDWMVEYSYLVLILLLILLALDGGVAYWLYARRQTRWAYWLWLTFMAVMPLFAGRLVTVGLFEPLIHLTTDLSK
jgi:type II secretory pathway component PulF